MRLAIVALTAVVAFSLHSGAPARAELPPNRNDPCSDHGRNTCGTLGVGFYRDAGYGARWFGDYRGAVPGAAHLFCIDARYWYASPAYDYEARSSVDLKNSEGDEVAVEDQERMAYAIWTYGRTTDAGRQAAVMLYTHALMGDMTDADVNPAAVGPAVAAGYQQIARAADRYHGPYRIETHFPRTLTVSRAATVRIRVVAASGAAVPNVGLALSGEGTAGLPSKIRTGSSGVASVRLVPTRAAGLQLSVEASQLASNRPRVYVATVGAAVANGQRLVAPSAQRLRQTFPVTHVRVSPRVVTQASAQETAPGATITDRVVVSGLGDLRVRVDAQLWGPFETASSITCTGRPFWSGSFIAHGDGTYETARVRLDKAGFYAYRESIRARPGDAAYTSRCGETPETTVVRARPDVTTTGTDVAPPGRHFIDRIHVGGLGTSRTTVEVELYGPFASSRRMTCRGTPRWTASVPVAGNGEYQAPPVRLRKPGVYMVRHRVARSTLVEGLATSCGETARYLTIAPRILTGRGDSARRVTATRAAAARPLRLRLARLGIDAPISAVGIDLEHGVLAIPASIRRLGWWSDSSSPTASRGAVLIAGHVDDADAGIGAFFALHLARSGDVIELNTADSATHRYTVTSVRTYPKNRLPLGVYSRNGPGRLVLVTCGGRFDPVSGHYPANIVVTARPA